MPRASGKLTGQGALPPISKKGQPAQASEHALDNSSPMESYGSREKTLLSPIHARCSGSPVPEAHNHIDATSEKHPTSESDGAVARSSSAEIRELCTHASRAHAQTDKPPVRTILQQHQHSLESEDAHMASGNDDTPIALFPDVVIPQAAGMGAREVTRSRKVR